MRKEVLIMGSVAVFAAGILFGRFTLNGAPFSFSKEKIDYAESNGKYTYINPLLFCSDQDISNYNNSLTLSLEKQLREYVDSAKRKGLIEEASVYYRDLNDGPWVLVNGTMRTVPASLLKVPTALAIYKHAEKDPAFLKQSLALQQKDNVNREQHFAPKEFVAPDTPYSIQKLIELMLKDSDNGALYLLGTTLPVEEFASAYSDLGIPVPTEMAPGYTVTARTYASFFRVLFNSSYLNHDESEYLLSVLADSTFTQGIPSGLPEGVAVAHKFGEFRVSEKDLRLNDCGIVYRTHDPYILCILTRGSDYDVQAGVISALSKTVYTALESQK